VFKEVRIWQVLTPFVLTKTFLDDTAYIATLNGRTAPPKKSSSSATMHAIEGTGVAGTGRCSFVFVHTELIVLDDGKGDNDGDAVTELLIDDDVGNGEGDTKIVDVTIVVDDAIMELDMLGLTLGEEEEKTAGGKLDETMTDVLIWNVVSDPGDGRLEEGEEFGPIIDVLLLIDVVVVQ
jgi:hypothetical protein